MKGLRHEVGTPLIFISAAGAILQLALGIAFLDWRVIGVYITFAAGALGALLCTD